MRILGSAFLFSLTLSVAAFADEQPVAPVASFPENIECVDLETGLGTFHLYTLNSEPESMGSDLDAQGLDRTLSETEATFDVSNECDNNYALTFSIEDLLALRSGAIKSMRGRVEYFNADTYSEEVGMEERKTTVECVLGTGVPEL